MKKPNVKAKLLEWKRILQVARKPGKDEFLTSTKICVFGIALIGAIGFAIYLAFAFLGF